MFFGKADFSGRVQRLTH